MSGDVNEVEKYLGRPPISLGSKYDHLGLSDSEAVKTMLLNYMELLWKKKLVSNSEDCLDCLVFDCTQVINSYGLENLDHRFRLLLSGLRVFAFGLHAVQKSKKLRVLAEKIPSYENPLKRNIAYQLAERGQSLPEGDLRQLVRGSYFKGGALPLSRAKSAL